MCAVPKSVGFQWVSSRNATLRVDGFDVSAGEYDAAKHLKVARQTYLDLEYGRTLPRLDTLIALSTLFNKSVAYFAGEHPSLDGFDTIGVVAELQQRYTMTSTDHLERDDE
ncbi:helix-turn-helix domain-containing protein [Photobacterium leiognathi]|uniref:helix-turn-helix domain-containing protein n=1 Tax=Photobacterium leiognathi TaxID=553611 RepID=UPI002738B846|nr:helix-turn-helix transcriptional regulator [Photobacterium leiognathi]